MLKAKVQQLCKGVLIYWEAWQLFASQSPNRSGWPAWSARVAPQAQRHKREVLRSTDASNQLRVSQRVTVIIQENPMALRTARISSARFRLAWRRHKPHASSLALKQRILWIGSFTGISTGRIETQRDGCPLIRSYTYYCNLMAKAGPAIHILSYLMAKSYPIIHILSQSYGKSFYIHVTRLTILWLSRLCIHVTRLATANRQTHER